MSAFESWILAYLFNSLWQVPLVFAAAWLAVRSVRGSSVAFEHRIWVSALALSAILPSCTLRPAELAGLLRHLILRFFSGDVTTARVTVTVVPAAALEHNGHAFPPALLAAIAIVYGSVIAYFVARLGWKLWKTLALRRNACHVRLTGVEAQIWQRNARLFDVANAQAATSRDVFGPVTIGVRRPVLLLPRGWETAFATDDLAAAIAHEFAHMHRRDFAKNLCYEVVSLAIAYHPVLWLMRTRITESREMLCDAMAADALDGRDTYAHSLLRLASTLTRGAPATNFHAIGIFDANIFERRVMTLTQNQIQLRGARRVATTAACIVLGLGTCASALALRIDPPAVQVAAIESSAVAAPHVAPAIRAAVVSAPVVSTPAVSAPVVHATALRTPAIPTALEVAPVDPVQEPAPAAEKPAAAARISAGVMEANLISRIDPVYPDIARAAKVSGAVVLHAIVGKDGSMQSLQAVSGPEMLKGAAIEAVKYWKYRPYLLNGEPTAVDTTITVVFSLDQ